MPSAGKPFRRLADIFDESVFAFVLGRNLVNFKRSRISNYIHHLVWSWLPIVASPYSVWSIVYLIAAYQSLSQIDRMLHTFFMPIDRLQWLHATMKYGSNPDRLCYGFPVAYLFLERKRPLVTVLLPGGASYWGKGLEIPVRYHCRDGAGRAFVSIIHFLTVHANAAG